MYYCLDKVKMRVHCHKSTLFLLHCSINTAMYMNVSGSFFACAAKILHKKTPQ